MAVSDRDGIKQPMRDSGAAGSVQHVELNRFIDKLEEPDSDTDRLEEEQPQTLSRLRPTPGPFHGAIGRCFYWNQLGHTIRDRNGMKYLTHLKPRDTNGCRSG